MTKTQKQKIEVLLSNSGDFETRSYIVLYNDRCIVNYFNHTTCVGNCEDEEFIDQYRSAWIFPDIDLKAIIDPSEYDECSGYSDKETEKLEKEIVTLYQKLNIKAILKN